MQNNDQTHGRVTVNFQSTKAGQVVPLPTKHIAFTHPFTNDETWTRTTSPTVVTIEDRGNAQPR